MKSIGAVNNLDLSVNNLGEKVHTVASEPFFYDTAYTPHMLTGAIPVDDYGQCCIATENGSHDKKACVLGNGDAQSSVKFLKRSRYVQFLL